MKRLATTILAVVGLAGCFEDPTSSLRNGPSRLRLSVTELFVAPAESVVVDGFILDDQGNSTPGQLSFSSANPAVALAGDLPNDTLPGRIQSSGYVVGVAGGETYVRVTALGVTDSIRVVTVPVAFTGTVSPATPTVGTAIVLTAPALMSFTATSGVQVGGVDAFITGQTATTLTFMSPVAAAGTVFVTGAVYLGSINLPDLGVPIAVTDPGEPANDAPAGGPVIALPAAVGGVVEAFGSIDGNDVDDFFTITTVTGDSLQVEVEWLNSSIDIDAAVFNATATAFAPGGNTGGTASDPEIMRVRLVAATTYRIYVNLYDDHGETTPVPYRIRITKRA